MYGALQWRGLSRNNGFLWQGRFVVQFPVAKVLFCLSATGFSFERVSFLWQRRFFSRFPVASIIFLLFATDFAASIVRIIRMAFLQFRWILLNVGKDAASDEFGSIKQAIPDGNHLGASATSQAD